jgi:C-terminal processing protease CtpA/Prc
MKPIFSPARFLVFSFIFGTCLLFSSANNVTFSQAVSAIDRDRAHVILKTIKDDIKRNYYDPDFHGVDIDARFKEADDKLKEATSNGQMFGIVAQAMLDLHDSHTFFVPPSRYVEVEYGWHMLMIGDKCYLTAIKPGSDADAKGLKPGDQLLAIEGYRPARENLWQLHYLLNNLQPRPGVRMIVQSPDGQPRQVDVASKVKQGKRVLNLVSDTGNDLMDLIRDSENYDRINAHRTYDLGPDLMVWKMPEFGNISKDQLDEIMDKAKRHKALIIDMRDNGGGEEELMLRLLGNLFDHDVKIGDIKRRKETKPLIAKTRGKDVFNGQLVMLVDSGSGSAAEITARVVQLEKRGTILGDQTAGAVMRSRGYDHQMGADTVVFYGASVTDADIVMTDGKSLENVGVTPDTISLPTGAEMRSLFDPVLSKAAELVGVKLEPAKAGAMFPVKWKP